MLKARRQNTILDRFYDETSAYLQFLESLNIPSEYLEEFLFPSYGKEHPRSYGRDDDQEVKQRKGDRLKALISFLQAEVKALQRIDFSKIGVGENNSKPNFTQRRLHFNRNNEPSATQLFVSEIEKDKPLSGSF
ncbi:hypothetical protein LAZ67_10001909 [Cordylochernes scorpioides]|uniref:Uncharacterized protein n=1 Tax=Cordylochernes scorpioides TaxID=51811 RepID=A0ABY6L014_9ARAC|nr:hypothetical protein LAZ67_10001909 [Cordylochernes scorpioides]